MPLMTQKQTARLLKQLFSGRSAALGTMHQKEQVIAPLFLKELGIKVHVPQDLNTDNFGTFTLDKSRLGNQKQTAVLKARAAMDELGLDIGIASEGTFGAHPHLPFGTANTEIIVFIDDKNGLEIYGGHVEAVSYAQTAVASNLEQTLSFAKTIDFPRHGIAMRPGEKKYKGMIKGIVDFEELELSAKTLLEKNQTIWLETDFRAHVNESRMKHIALAAQDLIQNIKRLCPKCGIPGFHQINSKPGLPCESCGLPTDLPLFDIYECDRCGHHKEIKFKKDNKTAYAGYCNYCNP
jgi:hypothetical protein